MQVILLERVEKLGQMGDVVAVKPGFARNFLLPKGKALRATKENTARFERERAQLEARNLELRKEAEAVAGTLDGQSFIVIRQAGDTGQLYGSVSARDVADAATGGGFSVDRGQIILDKPIKAIGVHDVRVRLHPEVTVTVQVNVARTQDEAELQAAGEDVIARDRALERAEEEAATAEIHEEQAAAQEDEGEY
ncbi:MAG: 50S ribosomal protein L9 [Alphaproteobacteria bacterium]|nr:50S ribosomal protein L9 [Alphaproteobacteria bacterium]MDX5368392.1 50S ribosomal protein L9 [Alphaproteobacteria bacterium]MDX5463187.1 50S ribosomal protein L9 [Alphaproteobacteria bacterium]